MVKATITILILICSGCMKPYYGYSENEWIKLSDQEKKAVKLEYQQIINAKNSQRHADLVEERKQEVIDFGVSAQ